MQTRGTQDLRSTAGTVEREQHVTQTDDDQTSREIIADGAAPDVERAAMLVVKRGPNAGFRFPLHRAVTSAGRDPRSDIFLDDVTVSRRHAEFRSERGELQVVDIGGLNGTFVNGQPIDSAVLTNGDEIQMGKFRLVLLIQPRRVDTEDHPQSTNRLVHESKLSARH
jgi:pSer/pThr/pTyr-binding forkhead associated (FHA) protein